VIERSFVLCREGTIEISHLPEELVGRNSQQPLPEPQHDFRQTRRLLDAATIRAALKRNNYNRLATARDLGIHKSTLFRRIRKLGMSLPSQDGRSQRR